MTVQPLPSTALRILRVLARQDAGAGIPLHAAGPDGWLVGDALAYATAGDLADLQTAGYIRYSPDTAGGRRVHVTPVGRTAAQTTA